jgi:MoaA/NifB/PqqE/SkfB family radical SAM enzyme
MRRRRLDMARIPEKTQEFLRSAGLRRIANLAHNTLERRLGATRPRSYPISLDVVLTKACNLNCTFCISSTVEDRRWLAYDLYERIAHELFPYAYRIAFCSGGEPLLYPKIRDALRLAGRYRLKTVMVSNGMLLSDEVCRWITADRSLTSYLLSFDGSTKASLERIRRGAKFDKIIENVMNLSRHKQDAKTAYPKLGLRYSVMKSNAEELPGICALAKSMGIASVDVSFVNFANDMTFDDSLFFQQDLAAEVFAETRARAREHGITVNLPPLPRDDAGRRKCRFPWEFVEIDTDGSVRFCYMAWIQTLGHFDDGFRQIWRGEHYRRIRGTLHTDSPYFPYCAHCARRNGTHHEAAHNHSLHSDAYTFRDGGPGLSFNRRSEENRMAFKARPEAQSQEPCDEEVPEEDLVVR